MEWWRCLWALSENEVVGMNVVGMTVIGMTVIGMTIKWHIFLKYQCPPTPANFRDRLQV